jgi:hypothetical protein
MDTGDREVFEFNEEVVALVEVISSAALAAGYSFHHFVAACAVSLGDSMTLIDNESRNHLMQGLYAASLNAKLLQSEGPSAMVN